MTTPDAISRAPYIARDRAMRPAYAILTIFFLLDAFKYAISRAFNLEPILKLQKEIARTRKSLVQQQTTSGGSTTDAEELWERRIARLEGKLDEVERRRSPRTRLMMRVCHYASVVKATLGCVFVARNADAAMFTLPMACVWPLGTWLTFASTGELYEGQVGAAAWAIVSATGSERFVRGALGPAVWSLSRSLGKGGKVD